MEVRFEVTRYRVNIEVCWDVVAPNSVNFGPKRMPNMRIIGTQKNSWSTTARTMTQPYPPSGGPRATGCCITLILLTMAITCGMFYHNIISYLGFLLDSEYTVEGREHGNPLVCVL